MDLNPNFEDAAEMLCAISEASEIYIDEYGYEWRVIDKKINENKRRLAWVEWRYKEGRGEHEYHDYYLKSRDE